MEEWEKHYHLSGGLCFSMYFTNFQRVIRFRVIGTGSGGYRKAINCETGEEFEFYQVQLLKKEYDTLVEIDCVRCSKLRSGNFNTKH